MKQDIKDEWIDDFNVQSANASKWYISMYPFRYNYYLQQDGTVDSIEDFWKTKEEAQAFLDKWKGERKMNDKIKQCEKDIELLQEQLNKLRKEKEEQEGRHYQGNRYSCGGSTPPGVLIRIHRQWAMLDTEGWFVWQGGGRVKGLTKESQHPYHLTDKEFKRFFPDWRRVDA